MEVLIKIVERRIADTETVPNNTRIHKGTPVYDTLGGIEVLSIERIAEVRAAMRQTLEGYQKVLAENKPEFQNLEAVTVTATFRIEESEDETTYLDGVLTMHCELLEGV